MYNVYCIRHTREYIIYRVVTLYCLWTKAGWSNFATDFLITKKLCHWLSDYWKTLPLTFWILKNFATDFLITKNFCHWLYDYWKTLPLTFWILKNVAPDFLITEKSIPIYMMGVQIILNMQGFIVYTLYAFLCSWALYHGMYVINMMQLQRRLESIYPDVLTYLFIATVHWLNLRSNNITYP